MALLPSQARKQEAGLEAEQDSNLHCMATGSSTDYTTKLAPKTAFHKSNYSIPAADQDPNR